MKILVSLNERLVARLDRAARRLGLSRSAYLARIAAKELGVDAGPGRDPRARRALAELDRLFTDNRVRGDATTFIRRSRDERGRRLARARADRH